MPHFRCGGSAHLAIILFERTSKSPSEPSTRYLEIQRETTRAIRGQKAESRNRTVSVASCINVVKVRSKRPVPCSLRGLRAERPAVCADAYANSAHAPVFRRHCVLGDLRFGAQRRAFVCAVSDGRRWSLCMAAIENAAKREIEGEVGGWRGWGEKAMERIGRGDDPHMK
eukprot:2407762-Pleurochrysis_carterae.AAC.1